VTPEIDLEILTWEQYGKAATELSDTIKESGFKPDLILAIARGGLFLAGSLGYGLELKNISVINVELYTGINEKLDVPVMLPPILNKLDLKGMSVLIADDVADSGETLESVNEFCKDVVALTKTAVIYQKPESKVVCDYVWKKTDKWIDFPWSSVR